MNTFTKFPEDDEIANHKIKALELNASQFQAKMKPLFNENTKLKQHVISLNFYIEERKLQLANLISDTGPNGEDRVLIKAVADFKQICDLLEEEIIRLNNIIIDNNNAKTAFQLNIKQLRENLQQETERHFIEKQQLIDQNRKLSDYHKQQKQLNEQRQNRLQMKIEDLSSQIMQLKLNEQKMHKIYKEELEIKTLKLNTELAQVKFEKQDQNEKFEIERRSYLKQLEVFSTKLNEVKMELINEYEYKIQSQRMKMDNQIQKLKDDCQDYKNQTLQYIEKNKILQFQIDRYQPYTASLEKDIQDLKYKVFLFDEQMKGKDSKLLQKDILIDQLNEQIKRLKHDKTQPGTRENIRKQGTVVQNNKNSSPDKVQQQKTNPQSQYKQIVKQREPIKQTSNPESAVQSSYKRTSIQKDEFNFEETTIEQYVENNRQEIMQSIQQQSRQSSVEDKPTQQIQIIKIVSNEPTSTIKTNNEGLQNTSIQYNKSLQTTQRAWTIQNDFGVQCDLIEMDSNTSSYYTSDAQLARCKNEIIRLKEEFEFKIKCSQDEITDMQDLMKISQVKNEQLVESMKREFEQQIQQELLKKDIEISQLLETIKDKDYSIKSYIDSEQLYELLIEDLNLKLKQKDEEELQLLKKFQEQVEQLKSENEIEQKRLLELTENLKLNHKQEMENLNNQHLLDQEQLTQERKKLKEQQADHEIFMKQTTELLEQAKSKEYLLDSYRRELLKTNEIVKYLSLEIENYKKINNIFRTKNDHISQNFLYNGMGFLPTEVQDKIKNKMNKAKYKQSVPSNIPKDAYAMNFQLQKGSKMKPAKLASMTNNIQDLKNQKQEIKVKIEQLNEGSDGLPKINSKNVYELERSHSESKQKILNKNIRSKTQQEDYVETNDPKRIIQDINQKELLLIQRSQMLLSQLNVTAENYQKQNQKKTNYSTCKI
ncbi:unnamed protein product (macronuclear) [Paramecium tetraurelia]|uniref:Uncharacterized protein n=1 Tax=Paramecium tetraurelia TaxID=5888 RepID=A0DEW7_PARTE|nr:uncharacterized protein GSPATT00016410001 [Paramecium tetraurelia]CAK81584.1 unnamed protein product [Paramecium tetraurelia]|eukprot:XP_001448981.1 hypothetical protein (macronuclear) [Paramecium tetraurelia strain d4-2]